MRYSTNIIGSLGLTTATPREPYYRSITFFTTVGIIPKLILAFGEPIIFPHNIGDEPLMLGIIVLLTVIIIPTYSIYEIATTQIPVNWILAGALIVLLIGLIFDQIKKIFIKKKKKK